MSTIMARRAALPPRVGSEAARWVVPASALVVVLVRLPFLDRAPGPDEGGFLVVGQQWHTGGSSLYGSYWVDRPPVLVTIFGWAAQLGGLVPLRLIGCLAAALVVVGAADVARRIVGARAARWTAVTAAAFLVNPLVGSFPVNGELLAAPLVLGGIGATIAALESRDPRRSSLLAAAAGTAMVLALLVKQNMADVAVFALVACVLSWRRREVTGAHLRGVLAAGLAGAVGALTVVAGWTLAHGTSLGGVYEAMYPFRFHASRVLATQGGGGHAGQRSHVLVVATIVTGLGVVAALACWAALRRHVGGTFVWALVALLAFDALSIVLGGNYWLHYLVQPVGVVAILAGVLVAGHTHGARALVAGVAVAAAFSWTVGAGMPSTSHGAAVGTAIGQVARPGDTIVAAYGSAEVVQTSGLPSPYPYLWSLPVKTLDPHLVLLDRTLVRPDAPTWIVVWHHVHSWGLDSVRTQRLVSRLYHRVAHVCGHTIYLRDGVHRDAPTTTLCSGPSRAVHAEERTS